MGKRLGRDIIAIRERPRIAGPKDADQLFRWAMGDPREILQEEFWVACLNTKGQATHRSMIYRGCANAMIIRVGEIFRPAILANSATILVAHNHPSGDPCPSPEDVLTTERIVEAGKLLSIELSDHIILGHDKFVSMKERWLGF